MSHTFLTVQIVYLCMLSMQICLPSLLEVRMWHVQCVGEVRRGDYCHSNAAGVPEQKGLASSRIILASWLSTLYIIKFSVHCMVSICRFGFFAMIVERTQKCSFMSLPKNALTADHTTLAKREDKLCPFWGRLKHLLRFPIKSSMAGSTSVSFHLSFQTLSYSQPFTIYCLLSPATCIGFSVRRDLFHSSHEY